MRSAFDAAIAAGNTYLLGGLQWRLAGESVINEYDLGSRYLRVRGVSGMHIKDADNQVTYATKTEIEYLADQHAAWGVEQWVNLSTKLQQISIATTIEQVNAVSW
jgi:hypothetical protein